jgi:hypothetical protein
MKGLVLLARQPQNSELGETKNRSEAEPGMACPGAQKLENTF